LALIFLQTKSNPCTIIRLFLCNVFISCPGTNCAYFAYVLVFVRPVVFGLCEYAFAVLDSFIIKTPLSGLAHILVTACLAYVAHLHISCLFCACLENVLLSTYTI
jgi:hypothetical protein